MNFNEMLAFLIVDLALIVQMNFIEMLAFLIVDLALIVHLKKSGGKTHTNLENQNIDFSFIEFISLTTCIYHFR